MEKPNYYAIIPAEVRYSQIKANAKLLYGEITCLSNSKGYCFASNNYFAKLYGVSKNTISLWIKDLKDSGFVSIKIVYKNKQIIERRISIIHFKDTITKNDERGIINNVEDNNIKINTTRILLNRKKDFENKVSLLIGEELSKPEFISYWTESNPKGTKMRFEMERTWDLNKRFKRWIANSKKWNTNKSNNSRVKSSINSHQKAKEMIRQMNNNTNN